MINPKASIILRSLGVKSVNQVLMVMVMVSLLKY